MTRRKQQTGQAFIEAGLVVALFVTIVLGIVEFGYAFMALNVITQAATAGARAASVMQVGARGNCGAFTSTTSIDGASGTGIVKTQIGTTAQNVSVSVTQTPSPGSCGTPPACSSCSFAGTTIPTVSVTVTGNIPYLFGLLGSSAMNFSRTVTFRDEGR